MGGIDTSAYSGVESDIRYGAVHKCTVLPVISAITSQSPERLFEIQPVERKIFKQSLDITNKLGSRVLKSAMLCNHELALELYEFLRLNDHIFYVIDPVLKSTSGTWLIDESGIEVIKRNLLSRADLIVPNKFELELLTELEIDSEDKLFEAGVKLTRLSRGKTALLKGGHFNINADTVKDILITENGIFEFTHKRDSGIWRGRGTCLSASITSLITRGFSIVEAVKKAIEFCSDSSLFHRIQ